MEYPKIEIGDGDILKISKVQLINLSSVDLALRYGGKLTDKAIFLPETINGLTVDKWIIVRDSEDHLCAVPLLDK